MANTAKTNSKNNTDASTKLRTLNRQISNLLAQHGVADFPAADMQTLVEAGLTWDSNPKTGYSSFTDYASDYITKYANKGIDKGALSDNTKKINDGIKNALDIFSQSTEESSGDTTTTQGQKALDILSQNNKHLSIKVKLPLPNKNAYTR